MNGKRFFSIALAQSTDLDLVALDAFSADDRRFLVRIEFNINYMYGPGCPLKKLLILRGPQGLFSN